MSHIFFGKFLLGHVVATPGVMEATTDEERISALTRHHNGDWGEVSTDDWKTNDEALESGSRLLSSYKSANGVKFWIITEYDRSITTFLLPDEY